MKKQKPAPGRLNERFLVGHKYLPPPRFPFLPELHDKFCKSWRNPFFACVIPSSRSNYANVKGLEDSVYTKMPWMEEALAGSLWKAPTLSSKPCQLTSRLVGKAYTAAGQARGALHTISVLQAYQANLLKDADVAGVSPHDI